MFQVGLPSYLRLNSGRSVSRNVNKTRKHFPRNIHGAHMFPQCFPVSHTRNIVSSVIFLFSRCKLCLRYTAGNFNENPSMRALAKNLRAQASEHSSNFCEQFEQRSDFASTFKFDVTIRYCSLSSSTLTRKDGVKSTVRQLALSPQCQGLRRKCFRGKINSIFLNAKGCNKPKPCAVWHNWTAWTMKRKFEICKQKFSNFKLTSREKYCVKTCTPSKIAVFEAVILFRAAQS